MITRVTGREPSSSTSSTIISPVSSPSGKGRFDPVADADLLDRDQGVRRVLDHLPDHVARVEGDRLTTSSGG